MKDKTRLLIAGVICLIAVALFVVGIIVLPDVIVMQVQADGSAGTTLPKMLGLILPLALSCVFAYLYYTVAIRESNCKTQKKHVD